MREEREERDRLIGRAAKRERERHERAKKREL